MNSVPDRDGAAAAPSPAAGEAATPPGRGGDPLDEGADEPLLAAAEAPALIVRRKGRRVTTDPVPGTDPSPAPVDRRQDSHDNDQRLRKDVPPHWG